LTDLDDFNTFVRTFKALFYTLVEIIECRAFGEEKGTRALFPVIEDFLKEADGPSICKVGWSVRVLGKASETDVPWKEYPTSSPFPQTPR
jgi:hypothetical protein